MSKFANRKYSPFLHRASVGFWRAFATSLAGTVHISQIRAATADGFTPPLLLDSLARISSEDETGQQHEVAAYEY